jgi:hypothetical protein
MRKVLTAIAAPVFVVLAWGAQTTSQSTAKKTTTPAKKSSTPAKKSGAARRPVQQTTWRTRQNLPTPERYKEIQSALAAKGYMNPEDAQGVWGQSSMEALKRFQADQKLDPTGKINSLSLIALGLGPRHD